MTRVVHCKKDSYDVYIGRPGPFGNPFEIGKDGNREEVVTQFAEWVLTQPELLAIIKAELRNKTLGCWCAPKLCHGDILMKLANE
jgi:hypothetical protein